MFPVCLYTFLRNVVISLINAHLSPFFLLCVLVRVHVICLSVAVAGM